jgi:O-antigen/teichoic acid export membrane protein
LLLLVGGALQTGLFSAGARFVEAAKTGHFAILTAIYPMMAGQKEDEDLLRTFRAPWIAMFALAGLASLSLFLLADPLIRVLFGLDYSAATPVVRILAWILLPYTVNAFLSLVFLSSGEEATVIRAQIASVSLLAILIIWWGGLYGSPGAAWAALQAEILQAGILLVQAGRRWRTVASHPIWRYE